ncbi:TetR/AcrR family transcriptional regulator [Streptosporangium roseum]|uniref:Transcriptional regulator, TetR family n=1 Tax=Streptosporangium roseum (strain ATCC 12428 / DSM 43021 / JCM 3005 / KCTC 9067 / NCIMB 10171 / NRRL 2505 / NI 9100) TaxID=479432 RepID=D2BAT2_STRRD|nr:TetR/AcrR family transcriptional regulator [Streptosporangium roseum]ACZ91696.1 putative transcriptional regulator, TetR family [Streptosporangium roseum DSM 43021]
MTTRREQTSTESRELILTAAAQLFAEKGYRQTTFIDVAERSGISRGSIPWHFGNKEGLLLAVLEHSVEMVRAGLAEVPEEVEDGLARFEEGFSALFARPTTKLFVTLLVEALEPGSPIHGRYVEIHNTLRDHWKRWLERLPLPPGLTAEALAVTIVGAGIGIHQQWLLAPERVDAEQALAALRAMTAGLLSAG